MKEGDGIGRILMIEFGEQDFPVFTIRCEREVGYCFELDGEHKNT